MKKNEIYWTLCNFGLAYMFVQIGYFGLESLQSTLNFRSGLGTTCVGVLNGFAVISNLFIGPMVVRWLSPKWSLFSSFLAHTVYILANFFPSWITLVPASALVGLTQSLNGIVYGVYIASLSSHHSNILSQSRDETGKSRDDSDVIDPLMTSHDSKSSAKRPKFDKENYAVIGNRVNTDENFLISQDASLKLDSSNDYKLVNSESSASNIANEYKADKMCFNGSQNNNNVKIIQRTDRDGDRASVKATGGDESVSVGEETGLEKLAVGESDFDNPATQKTFARFNSIIITFITTGGLLGNITSSLVLGQGSNKNENSSVIQHHSGNLHYLETVLPENPAEFERTFMWSQNNYTTESSRHQKICGIDHCPSFLNEEGQELIEPERYLVYIMLTIFLLCNVIGLVMSAILRPMYNERGRALEQTAVDEEAKQRGCNVDDDDAKGRCRLLLPVLSRFTETLRLLGNVRLLLTVVPMFWIGVVMSLTVGAFNQSFVGCSLGVAYVGYAMTSLRLLFVVTSHVAAKLLHCLPRRYLIIGSMILQLLIVGSWFALPSYEGAALLITCCALIGCTFGMFKTVFYGLYPLLFPDHLESALAHNSVWECLGMSAAFIASDHLCFSLKATISMVLTILALISYITLEIIIRPRKPTIVEEPSSESAST